MLAAAAMTVGPGIPKARAFADAPAGTLSGMMVAPAVHARPSFTSPYRARAALARDPVLNAGPATVLLKSQRLTMPRH